MTAVSGQGETGPPRRKTGSEYAFHEGGPRRLGPFSKPLGALLIVYSIAALTVAAIGAYGIADPRLMDPDAIEMADPAEDGTLILAAMLFFLLTVAERLLFFICVFFVCRFSYRAMRNLYTVRSAIPDMSPAATVYWYFVPVATWFMPPIGMSEIRQGSFAEAGWTARGGPVSLWWGSWIVSLIAASVANFPQTPASVAFPSVVVAMVASAVSALLLRSLVLKIAKAQLFILKADAASQFT